jgi:hypothetical protein
MGITLQNINWKAQSSINSMLNDEIGKKQHLIKKKLHELESTNQTHDAGYAGYARHQIQ